MPERIEVNTGRGKVKKSFYTKDELDSFDFGSRDRLMQRMFDGAASHLNEQLDGLNNNLGNLDSELDTLDSYFEDPDNIPSDYTFFEGIATKELFVNKLVAGQAWIDTLTANTGWFDELTSNQAFIDDIFANTITVTDTISSSNYSAGSDGFQIDGSTGNAEFNNVTARGDFIGTIEPTNESDLLNSLNLPSGLTSLTNDEIDELINIGSTNISSANWEHVSVLDQDLATSDSPTFAGGTLSGALNMPNSSPIQAAGNNIFEFSPSGDKLTIPVDVDILGTTFSANVQQFETNDPLVLFGAGNQSTAVDLGIIGERSGLNPFSIFDESADEWAVGYTADDGSTQTTVNIDSYADFRANNLTATTLDTGQGANELYPMDQGVRTSDDVEFQAITATDTLTGVDASLSSTLDVGGLATFSDDITVDGTSTFNDNIVQTAGQIGTDHYTTGFTGSGWGGNYQGNWGMKSLEVRETLLAHEMQVSKLRYSKGRKIFGTGGGKISAVTNTSGSTYEIESPEELGVTTDDFLLVQEYDPQGTTIIRQSRFDVTAVNGTTITADLVSGTAPNIGDDLSVVASADANRDSLIYVDPYGPNIDLLDGLSNFTEWDNRSPQVRVGNLNDNPATTGYGIRSKNSYFSDSFLAGDLTEQGNYLKYDGGSFKGVLDDIEFSATTFDLTTQDGMVIDSASGIDLANGDFWHDDGNARFSGGNVLFNADKSGQIAGGAISWDPAGATTLGELTATDKITVGTSHILNGNTNTVSLSGDVLTADGDAGTVGLAGFTATNDLLTNADDSTQLGALTAQSALLGDLTGTQGVYAQNLIADGNASIAGTLASGQNFYAGKLRENILYNARDPLDSTINVTLGNNTTATYNKADPFGGTGGVQVKNINNTNSNTWYFIEFDNDGFGPVETISFYAWARSDTNSTLIWQDNNQNTSNKYRSLNGSWKRIKITKQGDWTGNNGGKIKLDVSPSAQFTMARPMVVKGTPDTPPIWQETDGVILPASNTDHGMWANSGGFGGSVQNPAVQLTEEGFVMGTTGKITNSNNDFIIDDTGFNLSVDGSGYKKGKAITWGTSEESRIFAYNSSSSTVDLKLKSNRVILEAGDSSSTYATLDVLYNSSTGDSSIALGSNTTVSVSGGTFEVDEVDVYTEFSGDNWVTFQCGIVASGDMEAPDFITTSDRKVKSKIQQIHNPMSIFDPINLYSFQKEGKDHREIGLIAQEVQEGNPLLVGTTDHEVHDEILTLSAHSIASLAVGGVKALKGKTESLEDRVERLEQENEQLKQQLNGRK